MNTERRKKRTLRNAISILYCSLELLVVVLAFRGLAWLLDSPLEEMKVEKIIGSIISDTEAGTEAAGLGPIFCLDAGHGGKDGGTTYLDRLEKDDNLKLVLAVAEYLEGTGARTILTREDDTFMSLEARCEVANKSKSDIFVSFHRNEGDGNGVEIWVQDDDAESGTLAENIMQGLENAGISRNRGIKTGTQSNGTEDYYVNVNTDMPSCLIELGFINNVSDNQLFDENTAAYAAAVGDAILATYEGFQSGDAVNIDTENGLPEGSEAGSGTEDSAAAVPDYPEIADVESLSNTLIEWGQGNNVDEKNRPTGAIQAQEQYGDKNALFIGEDASNTIYLTFDEGYEYGFTESILDTLKEKGVQAVFFLTGYYVKTQPELIGRMIDDGHTLGNHTVNHPSGGMQSLSIGQQQSEVLDLHETVKDTFGYEMHLFRYPSGKFSEQSLAVVNNCNYKSVFWSFAYLDYDVDNQPDQAESLQKMVDKLHPGAVYLLHAESETNAAVLGSFIDKAREQGYEFALVQ